MGLADPLAAKINPPVLNCLFAQTASANARRSLQGGGAQTLAFELPRRDQTRNAGSDHHHIHIAHRAASRTTGTERRRRGHPGTGREAAQDRAPRHPCARRVALNGWCGLIVAGFGHGKNPYVAGVPSERSSLFAPGLVMLCVSTTPKPRDRYRYTRDEMFTAMAFVVLFLQVLPSDLVFRANIFRLQAAATLIARDPRRDG